MDKSTLKALASLQKVIEKKVSMLVIISEKAEVRADTLKAIQEEADETIQKLTEFMENNLDTSLGFERRFSNEDIQLKDELNRVDAILIEAKLWGVGGTK